MMRKYGYQAWAIRSALSCKKSTSLKLTTLSVERIFECGYVFSYHRRQPVFLSAGYTV
jgi:hypothetical protein